MLNTPKHFEGLFANWEKGDTDTLENRVLFKLALYVTSGINNNIIYSKSLEELALWEEIADEFKKVFSWDGDDYTTSSKEEYDRWNDRLQEKANLLSLGSTNYRNTW